MSNTNQFSDSKSKTPNKKPAIDENKTLIANLAFVISRKSAKKDCREIEFESESNGFFDFKNFCKDTWKYILQQKEMGKRIVVN